MQSFKPIQRETAVDAVEQELSRAILARELPAGERLLPERRLAEQFGVNRVTVRSALSRLSAAGLVSVRQGSGYVVRDFRRTGGPALLPGLADLAASEGRVVEVARELLFVRRHLARAVFERVLERADDADLTAVEAAVDAFAAGVDAGASRDELADLDLEVLRALLDATGSAVLSLCMNPVQDVLGHMPALRAAMYAAPETNVAAYRLVLGQLRHRHPSLVDAVVRELASRDEATLARIAHASSEKPS